MLQYDNDAIIEICSRIDLLEDASKINNFEQKGDSFFTNCSKHIDLTPSLSITPSKNLFHCFSCGIGGNVINWMMEFEGLTFIQSLDKAAKLADMDISKLKQPAILSLFKKLKKDNDIKPKEINREILTESMLDNYEIDSPQEWVNEGINPFIM